MESDIARIARIAVFAARHYRALAKVRRREPERRQSTSAEAFVREILDMGPVFIKIGQILSTRPDIMPRSYILSLAQLQEHVPPFSSSTAMQTVEKELKGPLTGVFSEFDPEPAASASLAQVHFARLRSGEAVAVKIRRPGASRRVVRDLRALEKLIRILRAFFPRRIERANLLGGFLEFKRYTLRELDFHREGEIAERIAANFRDWPDVVFPRVYWQCTTKRVLTMARVYGMRLSEIIGTFSARRRRRLSRRIVEMELKMFISDALFHADLHPGNIFFTEDGRIALLDFGMYGKLTTAERDLFVLYWLAVVENDVERAFYYFQKQCRRLAGADETAFYRVFEKLADRFYHSRLIDTSITRVYLEMIRAGYRYGFVFPSNLLLHAKALTTAEALTFELAPDTRFEEVTRPMIAAEFAKIALDPERLRRRIGKSLFEMLLGGHWPPSGAEGPETPAAAGEDRLWTALYDRLIANLSRWEADAGAFRAILNPPVRAVLEKHGWRRRRIDQTIDRVWERYREIEPTLDDQQTLGATFTLHLAAATIALFEGLAGAGNSREAATELIYEIGWRVYSRMAQWPLLVAGLFADDPRKKMEIATRVFRWFPFTSPDYEWQDVEADSGTVAFNCTRCHVAELFKRHDLADVCYETWCRLDFPLARQWGGWLERSNSIAGGAEICDFRWKTARSNAGRRKGRKKSR